MNLKSPAKAGDIIMLQILKQIRQINKLIRDFIIYFLNYRLYNFDCLNLVLGIGEFIS